MSTVSQWEPIDRTWYNSFCPVITQQVNTVYNKFTIIHWPGEIISRPTALHKNPKANEIWKVLKEIRYLHSYKSEILLRMHYIVEAAWDKD
jgi:hypothetical protein